MPNKRSKRKKIQHFFCPYCESRLWRLGGPKFYLFYENALEIKNNLNCSSKKAKILASHYPNYVDQNTWIEEFFCEKDKTVWLLLSRKEGEEKLSVTPPKASDWKRTTKTTNPNRPNPSVSDFTYRMSRGNFSKFS